MSAHVVSSKTTFSAVRRRAVALLALLCGIAATAAAQTMGTVTGRVTDASSGAPIADAQVRVIGTITGVMTRSDGTYRLAVAPGRYELRVSRIGYAAARDSVLVDAALTVTKDFRLEQTGLAARSDRRHRHAAPRSHGGRGSGAGGRALRRGSAEHGFDGDESDHSNARAVIQLSSAISERRNGPRSSRDASRPRA